MQLTLGRAAKTAGRSKGTISRALNSGAMVGIKDGERWRIDPAELSRWMQANPSRERSENRNATHVEPSGNDSSAEAGVLRERIERLAEERERERSQLLDQIEDLRRRLDGAEAERRQLNAVLTDRKAERHGLWERLFG